MPQARGSKLRVLAIDIGSSSVKAAVLTGPAPRRVSRQAFKTTYASPRVEVPATAILAGVKRAIADLGHAAKHVDLIVPTGMAPSWLAMDASGRALTPVVTHQDRRSQHEAETIEREIGRARHLAVVGNRPTPGGISSTTAAWFFRHDPQLKRTTTLVGHLNTWLVHLLTGERVIDPSNASFTGLYRTTTLDGWDDDLLAVAGVKRDQLPRVIDGNVVAGRVTTAGARRLGLTAGTPMLAGVIDGSGGLLLAGGKPRTTLNVVGSTDVLAVVTAEPHPFEGLLTRALGVGGQWVTAATVAAAGSAIDWAHRTFFADLSDPAFRREVAKLVRRPVATGLAFDARLAGTRTAVEPVRGTITNLDLGADRRGILSALLDSLARQSGQRFDFLADAGVPFDRLVHTTGGGAATLATVLRPDWPKGLRFKALNEATAGGAWRLAEMATKA